MNIYADEQPPIGQREPPLERAYSGTAERDINPFSLELDEPVANPSEPVYYRHYESNPE